MPESGNIQKGGHQGFVLPLEQLFDELLQAGFARDRLGYATRLRVQELLNGLVENIDQEGLKFRLAVLICQSAEEQGRFYEIFDSVASRFLVAEVRDIETPESRKKPVKKEPEKPETPAKQENTPPPAPKREQTRESIKAARSGPISIELKFRDDGYRPWNLPGMEAVVRPLREKEPLGAEDWDIPQTIDKTIRAGGVPQFQRKRRKQAPQYLLLIEQKSVRDHLAGLYADLAQEFVRRDVDADYYFYSREPNQCWKDRRDPSSYTSIERLHAEFPNTRLILIGEPDGLLAMEPRPKDAGDKFMPKVLLYPSERAFRLKAEWPAVALLNTKSTADWGGPEEALSVLFPVAPATIKGLGSLMEQWINRISCRPYFWKSGHPEPLPPSFQHTDLEPETIRKNIKNLKVYLGRQGYAWLCAISVYPEIYWQLTKILHDEAISATDVPDESLRTELWHLNLLRLSRLEWLRRGYIPSEYRQELRNGLPPANAADVRRQLLEVLGLDENKPPKDSYAEKDRIYTMALYDHERFVIAEQPDPVREAALREKLQEDLQVQGVAVSDIEDAVGRSLFENLPQVQTESVRNYWVLWADDHPGNNDGFEKEVAAREAIRFVNAKSTTEALKALETQKFDLVISDVSRSGIKDAGIKMMQEFKKLGYDIPVIFFTHPNYVRDHREELLSLGAVEVVAGFEALRSIFFEEIGKKRAQNEENLEKIRFLEDAKRVSKAVCRVVTPDGNLGTGMLLSGNYLLTARHVVNNLELLQDTVVEFNFEKDEQGITLPVQQYRLDPSDVIFSPPDELDFIRVKVINRSEAPLSQWGYIEPEQSYIFTVGEVLCLIHHAYGKEKQIELNKTIAAVDEYLYYDENNIAIPGATGAPVLNRQLQAVAMHHARKEHMVFGDTPRVEVREGIMMWEIIQRINSELKSEKEEYIQVESQQSVPNPPPQYQQSEPEMIFVKGGTFKLGNKVPVTLSDFEIGKYPVTQKLWMEIMGNNPSRFNGDDLPVDSVSWEDCQEFLKKLNEKFPGRNYRLPTEAEWEYAARGGDSSKGFEYAGSYNLDEVGWYSGNSDSKTHPVGQKRANELGINDMSGNVWEWCQDWFEDYVSTSQNDPIGPINGKDRVLRGGCWGYHSGNCRVEARSYGWPADRFSYYGFRLALGSPFPI